MDPITGLMFVLTTLATYQQYTTAKSNASTNKAAAAASEMTDLASLSTQEAEEASVASQQRLQRIKESLQEQASIRASSAEAGLAGLLPEKLIQQSMADEGQDIATINTNEARSRKQRDSERKGIKATGMSRRSQSQSPSTTSLVLQTGLNGFSAYRSNKLLNGYKTT